MIRTQRDIFGLGFFQDVTVDYEPTGDSSDINLTLKVQEKQTGTASAGAGFASSTGLTGFIELGHNNLFGNGQSINIHLERGAKRSSYEVGFTDPWFRDTPLTLGFSLFNTMRELDVYNRRDVGGGIRVGRPLAWPDYTRGLVSYDLRNVTLYDFVKAHPGESSNLTQLRNDQLAPPGQQRDAELLPGEHGQSLLRLARVPHRLVQHVCRRCPLGASKTSTRARSTTRTTAVSRAPSSSCCAARRDSSAAASVPDYERFRLGGTTVGLPARLSRLLRRAPDEHRQGLRHRGGPRPLPGGAKDLLIARAELQFPIADPLHGLIFFDAGNTWNSTREI